MAANFYMVSNDTAGPVTRIRLNVRANKVLSVQ